MNIIGAKLDQRKIYLFDFIETPSILRVIENIHYLEKKSKKADIALYINSDGGYVEDCMALIDVMDTSPCHIKTIVLGKAASAACLIASNGSQGKRYAGRNSEFMYHESLATLEEVKASQMNYWRKEFERIEKKCNQMFSKNTGQDLNIIAEMFLNRNLDNWMTAKEAKKFGIIDHILPARRRTKLDEEIIEEE